MKFEVDAKAPVELISEHTIQDFLDSYLNQTPISVRFYDHCTVLELPQDELVDNYGELLSRQYEIGFVAETFVATVSKVELASSTGYQRFTLRQSYSSGGRLEVTQGYKGPSTHVVVVDFELAGPVVVENRWARVQ